MYMLLIEPNLIVSSPFLISSITSIIIPCFINETKVIQHLYTVIGVVLDHMLQQ